MLADPFRRVVGAVALAVAVVTAIAVPGGHLLLSYRDAAEALTFKAERSAARITRYVATRGPIRDEQRPELAVLIRQPETGELRIRQKVYDEAGRLVLDEGAALTPPLMARGAPILVAGATVGALVVETSLSHMLAETALIGTLSIVLALAMFLAVWLLPMRALDRTLGDLHKTQGDLGKQNERFDAAITNMSQGLAMFGPDEKLLIYNPRFAEIYGIPPDALRRGLTTRELLELAFIHGKVKDVDEEGTLALQREFIEERKAGSGVERLSDGRSIAFSHRPMPDGGFVATFEDITERLRAEERIRHLAHFDGLTDLPNRVSFYDSMDEILGRLRRFESVAVLTLDLDNFKNVNDTLGHPVGDMLLKSAAERMRSCVRGEDIVARLSGDEFVVVQVPSGEPPNVSNLASRLIETVGAPYDIGGHQVVIGISIGIAVAPSDGRETDVLMKNADLALYRAKADGGGNFRFFEMDMDARMQARRALELDLRKAVLKGEFEVFYQPVVEVKTGRVTSCEAFLRWRHRERGLIAPPEFVPIAEESGLIVPIGEWLLQQACAEAVRWPNQVTVSVNLTPGQFKSRTLVQTVVNALAASGLPAGRLELEITELVLLQETESAFAILKQLRELGIKIAMDDFGTGYSSLGYLRRFPFDKIKIDESFVHDLPSKEDSAAIVRAVVGLSSSLGIVTIAEGVETNAQLSHLTSEGCNEVQGVLFSPPRPAAEIHRLLRELAPRAEEVA